MAVERADGPTPNGGDYSEAIWLDADSEPCSKELAVHVEITEYKRDGTVVGRTYADLQPGG